MARMTLQIGGSVVAPIASPGRASDAWRLDAFAEAALNKPLRRGHRFPLSRRCLDRLIARAVRAVQSQPIYEGEAL